MHDERDYVLACLYIKDRLAEADRERLLHEAPGEQSMQQAVAARTGATLVRLGQWLEAAGASKPTPRLAGDEFGRALR